jgi:hypothetical protein
VTHVGTFENWGGHGEWNMSNSDERDIVEQLDREVSGKGGLVTLVMCLLVAGGLLVVMAMDVFRPVG